MPKDLALPTNCTAKELERFISSLAQGVEYSPTSFSDTGQSVPLKSTGGVVDPSKQDKKKGLSHSSRSTRMSNNSTVDRGEGLSISSAVDFPVKDIQQLERGLEKKTTAISGRILCASYAKWDRPTLSWRMSQGFFASTISVASSGTWPTAGMTRSGVLYRLRPFGRHMVDDACGYWRSGEINDPGEASYPTPVGYDASPGGPGNHYKGLGHQAKYSQAFASDAVPTPTASDAKACDGDGFSPLGRKVVKDEKRKDKKKAPGVCHTPGANEDRAAAYTLETSRKHAEEGRQIHLAQQVRDPSMFPTPRSVNASGGQSYNATASRLSGEKKDSSGKSIGDVMLASAVRWEDRLKAIGLSKLPTPSAMERFPWDNQDIADREAAGKQVMLGHIVAGRLSPEWTERLMGWPVGWTNILPLPDPGFAVWLNGFTGPISLQGYGLIAWIDGTWEAGISRTVSSVKAEKAVWASRIKAIGNGQVPQCAATAFILLMERASWSVRAFSD